MDRSNYRIERSGNGSVHGVEGTMYHVCELGRTAQAFVHAGASVAPGFDRSDSECLEHWLTDTNDHRHLYPRRFAARGNL